MVASTVEAALTFADGTDLEPLVPAIRMPRSVAAATSRWAPPPPVWAIRRSEGTRSNVSARSGVRSRLATTMLGAADPFHDLIK